MTLSSSKQATGSRASAVAGSTLRRGGVPLADYASRWLLQRTALAPRTRELYEHQLRRHILPVLGELPLNGVTTAVVRQWYADLHHKGIGGVTVAKCYRCCGPSLEPRSKTA